MVPNVVAALCDDGLLLSLFCDHSLVQLRVLLAALQKFSISQPHPVMALTFVAASSSAGSGHPLPNAKPQMMPLATAAESCTYTTTMATGTIAGIAVAALRRSTAGRRSSAVSRAAIAVSVGQK
eukprot:2692339-Amphidinium_carterae.1